MIVLTAACRSAAQFPLLIVLASILPHVQVRPYISQQPTRPPDPSSPSMISATALPLLPPLPPHLSGLADSLPASRPIPGQR